MSDYERRLKEQGAPPYVLQKGSGRLILNQLLAGQQSSLLIDCNDCGHSIMLSPGEMLALAMALTAHARKAK